MSSPFQRMLSAYEQNVVTRNFDWEAVEDGAGNVALHSPDAPEILAQHGLEAMVATPGDTDFLASLPVKDLGNGGYGAVYEITGTGLVVKKHFPDRYFGGYEGQDRHGRTHMRQLSESTFLRDLSVNLALERALVPRDHYTTPEYLGHMMLRGENGNQRHYTVMTKLEEVEPPEDDEAAQAEIERLKREAHIACLIALRNSSRKIWFIDWDMGDGRGTNNLIPLSGEDGPELGVIDQRTLLARPKTLRGVPLVSRHRHDPDAPWLAVVDPELARKEAAALPDAIEQAA